MTRAGFGSANAHTFHVYDFTAGHKVLASLPKVILFAPEGRKWNEMQKTDNKETKTRHSKRQTETLRSVLAVETALCV